MLAIILAILVKLFLVIFKSPPMEISEIEIAKILFNISPVPFRILGLLVSISSSCLFASIISRIIKPKQKVVFTISFLLFFLSPWQNLIATFLPIQNILTLILLLAIYLKPKWKIATLTFVALLSIFYLLSTQKDYLFTTSLKPSRLGFEINERQKIDFLSVNKKYILPSIFRKITYNKPTLAITKLTSQFISFFDFDYWVSPVDSYAILKLSGYSPKGNVPLFFIWEIPLIVYGLLIYKNKKRVLVFLLISLFPYLVFETKILSKTAFLACPILLFLEVVAVSRIDFKKALPKIGAVVILLNALLGYYKLFFFTPQVYQTPVAYFLEEVSSWVNKNKDKYQNFVISPRFGPIEKGINYYLANNKNLDISFETFDLRNDYPKENTVYIGLVGEFVGRGKDIEEKGPGKGIKILERIKTNEEVVFEYGKEIWIGK